MEDKSLFNNNQPRTISEGLQNFIDAMVEEIVLEGRAFDTQKKYLKKFSENEGLDYEALEKGITELIETLGEMKTSDSKSLLKLALIQAKEAYVSDAVVFSIAQKKGKNEDKNEALCGIIQSLQNRSAKVKLDDSTIDFNVNGVEFKMVKVEGGSFWMGAHNQYIKKGLFSKEPDTSIPNFDKNAEKGESPVHKVTLDGFYLCRTEVTQGLWKAVMGSEPKAVAGSYAKGGWQDVYGKGENYPAYCVSFNDIKNEFLPKLNQMTGQRFRLPTEAEWEFAARGGNQGHGYNYAGSNQLDSVAWHRGNSENKTHPVRSKQANELGLYDMTGNVWELCSDFYGDYTSSPQTNPKGPTNGSEIVIRGGCWFNYEVERYLHVPCRCYADPDESFVILGFRLALSV